MVYAGPTCSLYIGISSFEKLLSRSKAKITVKKIERFISRNM